jgi:hypothetical protein
MRHLLKFFVAYAEATKRFSICNLSICVRRINNPMPVIASTFFGGWGGGGVEEVFLLWGQKQTCLSVFGCVLGILPAGFSKKSNN